MTKEEQLGHDGDVAERCLHKCPFRKVFDRYMTDRADSMRRILDSPELCDINKINYLRGALAQLDDISTVPKYILQMEQSFLKGRQRAKQKQIMGKAKKKEIMA